MEDGTGRDALHSPSGSTVKVRHPSRSRSAALNTCTNGLAGPSSFVSSTRRGAGRGAIPAPPAPAAAAAARLLPRATGPRPPTRPHGAISRPQLPA